MSNPVTKNWLKTLIEGVQESTVNLIAQNAPAPQGTRGKSGGCTPCQARARREAMRAKWGGGR